MGVDSSRLKMLAISLRVFIYVEWYGYKRFQSLSLILKFSIIIRTLFELISVFLRYFKVDWWLSK